MKPLIIKPTATHPFICLDPINKKYEISGKSMELNSTEVFEPIEKWFVDHYFSIQHTIALNIRSDYFNSSSFKHLLGLLRRLETLMIVANKIEIYWYFEDEEIENTGKLFSQMVSIPFYFVRIQKAG